MKEFPSFDFWSLVFLVAAVQGVFIGTVLLLMRRGIRLANGLLAAIVLLFAVTMFEYVLFWTGGWPYYPWAADLSINLPLLFGPLLWWYVQLAFGERPTWQRQLAHFFPFVAATAIWSPWHVMELVTKGQTLLGKLPHPLPRSLLVVAPWVRLAHMLLYGIWIGRYIGWQGRIKGTYRWAHLLNTFFVGYTLAFGSYYLLSVLGMLTPTWDYQVSAAMTAFVYLIAYMGFVQPSVFEGHGMDATSERAKYQNSTLTPAASQSLLKAIERKMTAEQVHLEPDISLEKLAAAVQASKHHVSQAINEQTGLRFFDYINQLRIEEAKLMLKNEDFANMHIIEVAYAVGFANKASFNAAFKKSTGMTPTAFRQLVGEG